MDKNEPLTSDVIYNVLSKIIGDYKPTGVHSIDGDRLERLENYIEVIHEIINDIEDLTRFSEDSQESVKLIGLEADNYLKNLHGYLNEVYSERDE